MNDNKTRLNEALLTFIIVILCFFMMFAVGAFISKPGDSTPCKDDGAIIIGPRPTIYPAHPETIHTWADYEEDIP